MLFGLNRLHVFNTYVLISTKKNCSKKAIDKICDFTYASNIGLLHSTVATSNEKLALIIYVI